MPPKRITPFTTRAAKPDGLNNARLDAPRRGSKSPSARVLAKEELSAAVDAKDYGASARNALITLKKRDTSKQIRRARRSSRDDMAV